MSDTLRLLIAVIVDQKVEGGVTRSNLKQDDLLVSAVGIGGFVVDLIHSEHGRRRAQVTLAVTR